jgi:ABC-type branched-subunit amino acid transport system ATPase component
MELKYNDLLVVVGAVGSGKTTFLHSIMEETRKSKGEIKIRARKIAYVE